MAKAFAFKLRQRVIVPNTNGAQGVVVCRQEQVNGDPRYFIESLTPAGVPTSGWVEHDDLLAANPQPQPAKSKKRK